MRTQIMCNYLQDVPLSINMLSYSISSEGEPEISETEMAFIRESLIEEIIESEEFKVNLAKHYEDENSDNADREYDRRRDDAMEANWESSE